jgi:hypothetical protein
LAELLSEKGTARQVFMDKDKMQEYLARRLGNVMATPQGEVYGFVTPEGGVYLDPEKLNANTPIHEFGHLWCDHVEKHHPALWARISELTRQTGYYADLLRNPDYAYLTSDSARINEAFAQAVGDHGERVFHSGKVDKSFKEKFRRALHDFWRVVGEKLGIRELSAGQIGRLTFRQAVAGAVADMTDGKKVAQSLDKKDGDLEAVSERFNEELERQIAGTLPKGHVYKLGNPGEILQSIGMPIAQIELTAERLAEKASEDYIHSHPFELSEVKDLPKAIQNPLAVFSYGDKSKAVNIITEIERNGSKFLVGISMNPVVNGKKLSVNSIRSIFPKDTHEWVNWINQGKGLYYNKEKVLNFLTNSRHPADVAFGLPENQVQQENSKLSEPALDSATKVIQNFENPKLSGEKKQPAAPSPSRCQENGGEFTKLSALAQAAAGKRKEVLLPAIAKIGGVALTAEQRKALAEGKTIHLEGLTAAKRPGQKFSSSVRWNVKKGKLEHSNLKVMKEVQPAKPKLEGVTRSKPAPGRKI